LLVIVVVMMIAALFATAAAGAVTSTATPRHVTVFPNIKRLGEHIGRPVRDAVILAPKGARTLARSALYGGTYRAASGDLVRVFMSDLYVPDASYLQAWADLFGTLIHGPELSTLTVEIVTPEELNILCPEADGCYFPSASFLYLPGSGTLDGIPVEEVATHEYGHHVANNRSNAPWVASDWGTKRWASYEDVCAKQDAGLAFPGDEAANYARNPGESFAESYMFLNIQRLGFAVPPWFFDPIFMPDYAALSAIQQDVMSPWTGQKTFVWKGRVTRARSSTLATTLDGNLVLRLAAPAGSTLQIYAKGRLVASTHRSFAGTICGARSIVTRIISRRAGRFVVTANIP
jgi:hypothetical protein